VREAQGELAALEGRVPTVELRAAAGRHADEPRESTACRRPATGPFELDPGVKHRLVVSAELYRPYATAVKLRAGQAWCACTRPPPAAVLEEEPAPLDEGEPGGSPSWLGPAILGGGGLVLGGRRPRAACRRAIDLRRREERVR
jgi:hypothetical protein